MNSNKTGNIIKTILAFLFWMLVWELCALWIGKELILPDPLAVLRTLLGLVTTGKFWLSTLLTILRIIAGYLLGLLAGILFSVLTCSSRTADALLSPLIRIVRATPVASFIILALLWMGKNYVPLLMSMLMVLPIVWGNITEAYRNTDEKLIEMGRAYRFKKSRMFLYIYVPSVLPGLKAACMTSVGLAWKSGIAAEVLSQPRFAMGSQLYYSKIYLETSSLFAWTAVVVLLSFLIEKIFKYAFEKLFSGIMK